MRVFVTVYMPEHEVFITTKRPAYLVSRNIPFYEVTRTRTPPYCFECMIALVKADDFTINVLHVLRPADSMCIDRFSFTAHFRSL